MRSGTSRVVVYTLFVLFVANWGSAAGPQFTGLVNFYNPGRSDFSETRNSLARMDRDGIIGSAVPLSTNWNDIVVAPDGSAYYAIVNGNQNIYRINPTTLAETKLVISGPGITDTSWLVGETWDTTRNRLVVGTLGGDGFFFGYFDTTNQWTLISNLHGTDMGPIAYRPANDTIYGIPEGHVTSLFKYDANGQQIGTLSLSQELLPLADQVGKQLWQMMLASDGQLAVIAPQMIPNSFGGTTPGSWLYLINPDTGVVTYSGPLAVPEPAAAGLLMLGALILRRRIRR